MKSKKIWIILIALILFLLAAGIKTVGLLTEKIRENPIPEQTQAIVFLPTEEDGVCRVIEDEKMIARLRKSYRWTNAHMFCCMKKPLAYLDVVIGGAADPRERSEYHGSLLTDSYNPTFRYWLHRAWETAPVCTLSAFDLPSGAALTAAKAALPHYLLFARSGQLYVVSAQPLTADETQALQNALQ